MSNNKEKSDSGNFLVQGSILAAAGIIVRFIGLLYKIPMTRAIGDEGIGYYNTAYEIYNIGLILSSYSLPLAISKLIAARRVHGKNQDVQRVFQAGLLFGLVAGGLMTTILLFGADWITVHIFNSPNSALPLKVMAPTILVFSIMGVVRGYFQGLGNMVPTSISQVIEQVVNAIISVAASFAFMHWYSGYTFRCTGCLRVPGSSDVFIPQTECKGIASSPGRPSGELESCIHGTVSDTDADYSQPVCVSVKRFCG